MGKKSKKVTLQLNKKQAQMLSALLWDMDESHFYVTNYADPQRLTPKGRALLEDISHALDEALNESGLQHIGVDSPEGTIEGAWS